MPKIIFTVTNDLNYDQRMQRICGSLADNGYDVLLVGRKRKGSIGLQKQGFDQHRLTCFFEKGILFYVEYNLRLFFFLLFHNADLICAIDLDTILPVYFTTVFKRQKRVYDAHELFTEQKEVVTRKGVYRCWLAVEKFAVPRFQHGYTVNRFIADELQRRYQVKYAMVRNLPTRTVSAEKESKADRWLLYQGSVNEGRCFETLIPAMQQVQARLVVCGEGNFFEQAKALVTQYSLEGKVVFKGYVLPEELKQLTPQAYIGINLFEREGLNQYHSLSNRFFDYMMAGIPQLSVNYPEYVSINKEYAIASLINDTSPETIAAALNNLLANDVLYQELRANCLVARKVLNWEEEEKALLHFYQSI